MKKYISILFVLSQVAGCGQVSDMKTGPKNLANNAELNRSDETLNLIGGTKLNNATFPGVGQFDGSNTRCTFTRISKRHFLTASHCVIDLNDKSGTSVLSAKGIRKNILGRDFQFDFTHSIITKKRLPAAQTFAQYSKQFQNKQSQDWAVFTFDFAEDLFDSADQRVFFDKNYGIAKYASNQDLQINQKVQLAGWGDNADQDNVLARCTGKGSLTTCISDFNTVVKPGFT